jgi:hypothetical protein
MAHYERSCAFQALLCPRLLCSERPLEQIDANFRFLRCALLFLPVRAPNRPANLRLLLSVLLFALNVRELISANGCR